MSREDPPVSVPERPMSLSPCFLGLGVGDVMERGSRRGPVVGKPRAEIWRAFLQGRTLQECKRCCGKSSREAASSLQQLPMWSSSRYCYQKVKRQDP